MSFTVIQIPSMCAQKANVPCVPGSDGLVLTEKDALDVADKIGFPLMIKATAGGSGMEVAGGWSDIELGLKQWNGKAARQAAFFLVGTMPLASLAANVPLFSSQPPTPA